MKLFIGSYAQPAEDGLHVASFDPDGGRLRLAQSYAGNLNPSFLALSSDRGRLFAVNENGDGNGSLAGFRIADAGRLDFVNRQGTGGSAPCHVGYNAHHNLLVCCNYAGGSLSVHAVSGDGEIAPARQVIMHQGRGPHPDRQSGPHPHCVLFDETENLVLVSDLGCDAVFVYAIGEQSLVLRHTYRLTPGCGPRHMAMHPDGHVLYLLNELDNTIVVFRREGDGLKTIQTVSTLPENYRGDSDAAGVHVSADGRFLYASNRGHDSIALYAVAGDGRLAVREHVPSGGRTPRCFTLSPDNRYLLAANQDSDSVIVFARDMDSGVLMRTPYLLKTARPSCLVFAS